MERTPNWQGDYATPPNHRAAPRYAWNMYGKRLAVNAWLARDIGWKVPFARTRRAIPTDYCRIHTQTEATGVRIAFMIKRALFPIFLGLLALTLVACGGGDGDGGDAPEPTDAPAQATLIPANTVSPNPTQPPAAETPVPTLVATEGELFLKLISPPETEVLTDSGTLAVVGRTRVDAVVTINDTIVEPDIDGEFSLNVPLEEGPNIIEVVASVASGEQMDLVLVAIYLP